MPTAETLIHYSSHPLHSVRSVVQGSIQIDGAIKPRGLWFSVETEKKDGWREWCHGEGYGLKDLKYRTQVVFLDGARVLRICGAEQIDEFTLTYGHDPFDGKFAHSARLLSLFIDWKAVAEKYDAMVISPYCWERRLEGNASWYYGWDCASGCVWNAAAIALSASLRA